MFLQVYTTEGKITVYVRICTSRVILGRAKSSFHEGTIHTQPYKTIFRKINLHLIDDFNFEQKSLSPYSPLDRIGELFETTFARAEISSITL